MDLYQLLAVVGALLSAEFVLGVWQHNQFDRIRRDIERVRTEIQGKLEYHERHDDQRFNQVFEAIWKLKLDLAESSKKDKND